MHLRFHLPIRISQLKEDWKSPVPPISSGSRLSSSIRISQLKEDWKAPHGVITHVVHIPTPIRISQLKEDWKSEISLGLIDPDVSIAIRISQLKEDWKASVKTSALSNEFHSVNQNISIKRGLKVAFSLACVQQVLQPIRISQLKEDWKMLC